MRQRVLTAWHEYGTNPVSDAADGPQGEETFFVVHYLLPPLLWSWNSSHPYRIEIVVVPEKAGRTKIQVWQKYGTQKNVCRIFLRSIFLPFIRLSNREEVGNTNLEDG